MKRVVWMLLALMGLLSAVIWPPARTWARPQAKSVTWERIAVTLEVDKHGVLHVQEQITVYFHGGPFRYGYRRIPRRYLSAITHIQVRDENTSYVRGQQAPGGFIVQDMGEEIVIRWFFSPIADTRRTFTLSYQVHGALRFYPQGEQLWWQAVFPDRDGPVQEAVVTVRVPGEIRAARAYFVPARVEQIDAYTVRFTASKAVPAGTPFEVRVEWPAGVVAGTPAPWQAQADQEAARIERQMHWEQRWKPLVEVLTVAFSVFLLVGGSMGLLSLWYTKGRDPETEVYAEYLTEPPSSLPPAVVGALVDEAVDVKEVLATLFDLARRGYIEIFEDGPGRFRFVFRGNRETLRPFERNIVHVLFRTSHVRRLKDWKYLLSRSHVKAQLATAIFQEAVRAGLFSHNPARIRLQYTLLLGVPWLLLGSVLSFIGFNLNQWLSTAWCPGVALLGLGLLGVLVAQAMPRKTRKGAEEAAKWEAFRRYLEGLERVPLEKAGEILERYLPYAIALGVERRFLDGLRRIEATAPYGERPVYWPRWYHLHDLDASSPTPSYGGKQAAPASSGSLGKSLNQASRTVGASLSRLSTNLGHLLSVSAQTLSMTPSSGSGSFSGGGSSGGGGGGGGGGGFG